jgi:hypothetical protein
VNRRQFLLLLVAGGVAVGATYLLRRVSVSLPADREYDGFELLDSEGGIVTQGFEDGFERRRI